MMSTATEFDPPVKLKGPQPDKAVVILTMPCAMAQSARDADFSRPSPSPEGSTPSSTCSPSGLAAKLQVLSPLTI